MSALLLAENASLLFTSVFQTQPVFDENDDDDDGSKAHPKIIGMTDSSKGEGGKAYRRAAVFPCLP